MDINMDESDYEYPFLIEPPENFTEYEFSLLVWACNNEQYLDYLTKEYGDE